VRENGVVGDLAGAVDQGVHAVEQRSRGRHVPIVRDRRAQVEPNMSVRGSSVSAPQHWAETELPGKT
jgi:hypothetical protein